MRIPVIPTIVVLLACAIMVWLGVWQLGRADEKAELIARYEAAAAVPDVVELDRNWEELIYRQVRMNCSSPSGWQAVAGRNQQGRTGYVHRYLCFWTELYEDDYRTVGTFADIGWSPQPADPVFEGGEVVGTLVRLGDDDFKLVSSQSIGELAPIAKPNPSDLPNNHLSYAVQWFLFALTALVIYILALRRRGRDK